MRCVTEPFVTLGVVQESDRQCCPAVKSHRLLACWSITRDMGWRLQHESVSRGRTLCHRDVPSERREEGMKASRRCRGQQMVLITSRQSCVTLSSALPVFRFNPVRLKGRSRLASTRIVEQSWAQELIFSGKWRLWLEKSGAMPCCTKCCRITSFM
jgi:hypothetical protein